MNVMLIKKRIIFLDLCFHLDDWADRSEIYLLNLF